MRDIVTLEGSHWRVGLVPATGGSVAFAQTRIGDEWEDVLRPTSSADLGTPSATASYPLVPWSNRIRDAVLRWEGVKYALRVNRKDGTAIHGTGWEFPWRVAEHTTDRAVLEFDSRDYFGVNWPWTFVARYTYALEDERFVWTYGIENVDSEPFPAGLGHHPYLLRSVAGSPDALLEVGCTEGYELEGQMAVGHAGGIPPHADFSVRRSVGDVFVDDLLTGRMGAVLATVEYPDTLALEITADPLLSHVVVYVPPGREYFALEPVTNANDAFTLLAAGVEDTGIFLVQPGATVEASFTIAAKALR